MKLWWLCLFNIIFPIGEAWAAACCGGGFATPSLISGDHKTQFTASYSLIEVAIDSVDSRGIWNKWDEHQRVQTLRIEGAYLISDRWQMGVTLPIIQRSRLQEEYSGLGDVSLSFGYEWLTDWDYNPYKPKGIIFTQVIIPTGKSKVESEWGGLDSRGNGFWALGVGMLLTKAIGSWDVFATSEVHRSFGKSVNNAIFVGNAEPGTGGSATAGAGYNLKTLRFGGSLSWFYEDAIDMKGAVVNMQGALERFATAQFSVSYMASDSWAYTLSYTDQTLFGSPINTSLGRGFVVLIQNRTLR